MIDADSNTCGCMGIKKCWCIFAASTVELIDGNVALRYSRLHTCQGRTDA